jgi:hypothetical protein
MECSAGLLSNSSNEQNTEAATRTEEGKPPPGTPPQHSTMEKQQQQQQQQQLQLQLQQQQTKCNEP